MPGSDLKTFKMTEKDADLVGPFFDSEDDEVPVDMELVFEAMKHVPLPDLDYPEQDDPICGEPSLVEPVSARASRADPDSCVPKAILKRKVGTAEMGQSKNKVGGTGRVSKRLKVEVQNSEVRSKTSPMQAVKAESTVGVTTDAAAKVAAEVAPNVVTGGVVAEIRPRPDFSLWTVGDDLLLKNAMEAGAAMEALAKGAMRFSYRYSVRELRERWRALLYDPEISEQAATRMVEAEYGSSYSGPKSPTEQKNPQELARKRRANSIRTLYYKRSKKAILEDIASGSTKGLAAGDMEGVRATSNGLSGDIDTDPGVRTLINALATCPVDTACVSPKDATSMDFEDRTFSQMFSLLAAGGVQAVIGDIPASSIVDASEHDVIATLVDAQNTGSEPAVESGFFELGLSAGETCLPRTGNGQLTSSGSLFEVSGEVARSDRHIVECMEMHASTIILSHDCQDVEDGSTCTDAVIEVHGNLQLTKNCLKIIKLETEDNVGSSREENGDPHSCTGGPPVMVGPHDVVQIVNGGFEDHFSVLPPISRTVNGKDTSGISSLDTQTPEMRCFSANISELKDGCPYATSLVSTVNQRDGSSADIKALCSSPQVGVDTSNLEAQDSTQLLERGPWLTMDKEMDLEMEESDKVEDVYRECRCGENCTRYVSDEGEDDYVYDDAAIDGKCFLREHDSYLPSVLTGESCTLDLDCEYEEDCCDLRQGKLAPSVLGPYICAFNTEDTEIPSLDGSLLSSPSPQSSPSDQGEYPGCTDSPYADADADGYTENYADAEVDGDGDADDDYIEFSPRQGVGSMEIEPTSTGCFCEPLTDLTELGPSVDRSGGKMSVVEEKAGFEGASLPINPPVSTLTVSGPDQRVSSRPPDIGYSHQQSVAQAGGYGGLQPPSNCRALEMRVSLPAAVMSSGPIFLSGQVDLEANADVEMGNRESEMSPSRDLANVLPSNEKILISGEVFKLRQEPVEEELESDEEMARFSDIEAMILDMDLDVADDDFSARAESRRMYRQHGRAFVRSEQAATAAMQRTLNLHGALATLYGRHLKYYITQTEVLMGRATSDNVVDIDLGKEGRANKVSRQQANIKLKDDGVFYLRNLGRRGLTVNNKSVETGQRAILGSNCLIEVGGMRFIFETNRKLVKDHIERRRQPQ